MRSHEHTDAVVLHAIRHHGGGATLGVIASIVAGDVGRQSVGSSLRRLQKRGLVFAHDNHGTLSVWGGIASQSSRYWSTREQMQARYGYDDGVFPKGRASGTTTAVDWTAQFEVVMEDIARRTGRSAHVTAGEVYDLYKANYTPKQAALEVWRRRRVL